MHRHIEFSIITVALFAIFSVLILCSEILLARDLNATVIDTTVSPTSTKTEPLQETKTIPVSTSASSSLLELTKLTEVEVVTKPENVVIEAKIKTAPVAASIPVSLANLLHSLTNTARLQNDEAALIFDSRLNGLAKERSEDMIRLNYFSHTSPDGCDLKCRFTNSDYTTLTWGENLAESTSYEMLSQQELAQMFTEKWLKSAGHRDNLLSNKFTHQGIGVASEDGRIVVTVIFAAF
jgi:uncharacterized protein YkwD